MIPLRDRLIPLDPAARTAAVRAHAGEATTDQVIEALIGVLLTDAAERHLIGILMAQGAAVFDPLSRALLAAPLADGAGAVGEALVRLLDDDSIRDARVVPTLMQATESALDAGADTHAIGSYVLLLRDCATILGSLPQASSLGKRVRDLATTEANPSAFVHFTTRWE